MLMAGSATAFGRREFIGPLRLQLMHMKMNRACQVISWQEVDVIGFSKTAKGKQFMVGRGMCVVKVKCESVKQKDT